MHRVFVVLLLFAYVLDSHPAPAQAPQSMLSPQAAFDQATAPVEITHRSIANWSDIEIAALGAAIIQAKDACIIRNTVTFTGDDLIAFARLCALGQQWNETLKAAATYIQSTDAAKPQLPQAYAYKVQAELNLKDQKSALSTCLAMLQAIPYGSIADEVTTTTLRYLQLAYTADALTLHSARQPYLLRLLRSPQTSAAPSQPAAAPIPRHTLFEHALDFAALEQYENQPRLAAAILADLDAAVAPAVSNDLSPDDALLIAAARHQYALLGAPLPSLSISAALLSSTATPRLPADFGTVSIFLLFPPWCAQCIRQSVQIVPALARLDGSDVHIYAMLADDSPPPPTPLKSPAQPPPTRARRPTSQPAPEKPEPEPAKSPADRLRGTPTFIVAPKTLTTFGAADFPFLIATDKDGIIRLLLPAAPENAFDSGAAADQIAAHIAQSWPIPADK